MFVVAAAVALTTSACVSQPDVETKAYCPAMARPGAEVEIEFFATSGTTTVQSFSFQDTEFTVTDGLTPRGRQYGFTIHVSERLSRWGGPGFGRATVTAAWSTIAVFRHTLGGTGYGFQNRVPVFGSCTFTVLEEGEPIDVSGVWETDFDVKRSDGCDEDGSFAVIRIEQDGTDLVVTGLNGDGPPWTGTVDGQFVDFGGTRAEDDGTTTSFVQMLFSETLANGMGGTETWSWSDGRSTCDGKNDVTMQRLGD